MLNIMKFRPLFLAISLTLIAISCYSIFTWGFRSSIDFAGGSVWEFTANLDSDQVKQVFTDNKINLTSLDRSGAKFATKFENVSQEVKLALEAGIRQKDSHFSDLRFESLGPSLGKELLSKTIAAIVLSSISLMIFIGSRFRDFSFGASAITAMFHDAFILIGGFSLLGHFFGAELDALFVTALLTTLSASVHDTVVTFDRIRELRRQSYQTSWIDIANQAVSEVLVRSINNSMTIIFMLLALVVLGGESTRWFATALLIGCVCGTYSSTGVAIPIVLFWKSRKKS